MLTPTFTAIGSSAPESPPPFRDRLLDRDIHSGHGYFDSATVLDKCEMIHTQAII